MKNIYKNNENSMRNEKSDFKSDRWVFLGVPGCSWKPPWCFLGFSWLLQREVLQREVNPPPDYYYRVGGDNTPKPNSYSPGDTEIRNSEFDGLLEVRS